MRPLALLPARMPRAARALAPALALLVSGCLDTRLQTFCDAGSYAGLCTLEVTGFTPAEGPVSGTTLVTLTGHGFDRDTVVTVDGVAAELKPHGNEQLGIVMPAHAEGSVELAVSNSLGSAVLPTKYRYAAPPTVTQVSPAEADRNSGATVTLTGTHLTGGHATVGGLALTGVVASETQLTGVLPVLPRGHQDVVVTTVGGSATLEGGFFARAWNRSSAGWHEAYGLDLSAVPGASGPLYMAVNGGDVYRTAATDTSWERVWSQAGVGAHGVSVSPVDPARVLSASRAGLFLTTDAFATTSSVASGPVSPTVAFTADGTRALSGDSTGILLSRDAGSTWVSIPMAERIDRVATARDNTTLMAATSFTRLFISRDGGETWETRTLPQPGGFALEVSSTRIAVADQSNLRVTSPVAGSAFATCDAGNTAVGLASDPGTPGRLWATAPDGSVRYTDATATTCTAFTAGPPQSFGPGAALAFVGPRLVTAGPVAPWVLPSPTGAWAIRDLGLQAPQVASLAVGVSGTDRRLFGHSRGGQVYRRADDGTWAPYGPSLGPQNFTGALYASPEGSGYRLVSLAGSAARTLAPNGSAWVASTGFSGTLFAFAQDPSAPGTIVVSDGAAVYRSVDGGVSFSSISAALPGGLGINQLEADGTSYYLSTSDSRFFRTSAATIQWIELPALTGQGVLRGMARASNALLVSAGNAGVFRLDDGAVAWTASGTSNFASENLRADPRDRRTLYVRRGGTFQRSTDSGLSWANVNDGAYPEESIWDCVVDPLDGRVYLSGDTPVFESVAGGP